MAQEIGMLYDTLWHIQLGAQLSGSGAQLSGSGAQLSGSGAQLSAISVSAYLHTSYLGAQLSASRQFLSRSDNSYRIFRLNIGGLAVAQISNY